ncbi:hypothetical protein [Muricauda sp. MAR_2010_75]|uniref:hypothetical protein n=1 Tax=Allomuricauda sp. MAR_2010_75 TaxID=1250232 RepID=UPI00055DEDF8|nr:hypothetical protein [Muricauda sp. MAR_2010_75]
MARIKNILINKTSDWSQNIRPRVGSTIKHNGYYWSNATGINSEPGLTNDWVNCGIVIDAPTQNGSHVVNLLVTDVSDNPHMIVSGTYVSGDPKKLESYSPNSMTRAL